MLRCVVRDFWIGLGRPHLFERRLLEVLLLISFSPILKILIVLQANFILLLELAFAFFLIPLRK